MPQIAYHQKLHHHSDFLFINVTRLSKTLGEVEVLIYSKEIEPNDWIHQFKPEKISLQTGIKISKQR